MVEIVQKNSAHRKIAKLFKCRGALDVSEDAVGLGRLESKRDEAGKSAGLILQFAKLAEVIRALSQRFDMTVEHGARAATAHGMPHAMDVEPFSGSFFAAADLIAHDG